MINVNITGEMSPQVASKVRLIQATAWLILALSTLIVAISTLILVLNGR